jgi:hypothetical protein
MWKIALTTSRNGVVRGRHRRSSGGICGAITAHSSFLVSLAWR